MKLTNGFPARKAILAAAMLVAALSLSACDSAEERAEQHFQSALELLEAGDEDRAIVELRNVFQLNGLHREARAVYARLQRERGNVREAIGQYLRLSEQYPDDLEASRALSEMYAEIGNWPEMERFLQAVLREDPNDPKTRALKVIFDYRTAIEERDAEAAANAAARAEGALDKLPDYMMLRQVLIDDDIRNERYQEALAGLDEAIEISPNDQALYAVRLSVLGALGDPFAIEAQLKDMIERFPEDPTSRITLVRWYVSQGQLDEAEQFLRDAVRLDDPDNTARLTLLRFLSELRGRDVALAELEKMIAAGQDSPVLQSLRAGLKFEMGEREAAMAELASLIGNMEPGDEARNIKVAYAQMLLETGNAVGARAQIEEVLAEDKSHVAALKIKASWLIEDDRVGDAIVLLRAALDQAPRDSEILTLMARAHERDGNQELVGEMLALAVDASNRGAEESVRYGRYLSVQGKFAAAEAILLDALRLAPGNLDLLVELGNVYLGLKEWDRSAQVVDTLRSIGTEPALQAANALQARLLQAQDRIDEAVSFLEGLVETGDAGFDANVTIVRSYVNNGEFDKARAYLDGLLADAPDDTGLLYMRAAVDAATGNLDGAEATFRALLEKDDSQANVWVALYQVLSAAGKSDEANRLLATAQEAVPEDPTLEWLKAGMLERDGDLEGAIAVYEKMYARDSNNLIVANNLASLLSATREDPETIERAYTIARRLRGSPIPYYQDTYGWLSHLRGDHEEALKALEPAAAAMTEDPMVQFHLAEALAGARRIEEAVAQYQHVLDMVGAEDTRPFVEKARTEHARLSAELEKGASQ